MLLDGLELKACHTICDVTDESHTRRESHAGFALLQYNSEQKGARGSDLSVSVDRFVSSYVLFFSRLKLRKRRLCGEVAGRGACSHAWRDTCPDAEVRGQLSGDVWPLKHPTPTNMPSV